LNSENSKFCKITEGTIVKINALVLSYKQSCELSTNGESDFGSLKVTTVDLSNAFAYSNEPV